MTLSVFFFFFGNRVRLNLYERAPSGNELLDQWYFTSLSRSKNEKLTEIMAGSLTRHSGKQVNLFTGYNQHEERTAGYFR